MTDLARAHNHSDANVIASPHCRVGVINRSCNRPNFSRRAFRQRKIRFFTNRESRREFGLPHFASRRRVLFFPRRRNRENIHAQLLVLQKVPGELVLSLVLIRRGHRRIRSGEAMRMHQPVHIAVIGRRNLRHVTIRAIHRRLRIVKRARALPGDTAGLPVVIFIEAANPPVTIHGDIQMNLVARRTEFRGVRAHERFQEGASMRLGVQANPVVVQPACQRWQASDFMKYLEGMLPPCFVCAELGKNFPCGPSPSASMDSGGISGLEMRFTFFQATSRVHHVPAAMPTVTSVSVANPNPRPMIPSPCHSLEMSHEVARKKVPRTHSAMCAYNHGFRRSSVPILLSTIPRTAPAKTKNHPRRVSSDSLRSKRAM